MMKVRLAPLVVLLSIFLAHHHYRAQAQTSLRIRPTPLCLSQFTLANRACAIMPLHGKELQGTKEVGGSGGDDDDDHHRDHYGREHSHGHGHGHGRRGHGHGRRHGEHEEHDELTRECCRWLKEIDAICVCDVLLLHQLPIFLTRPNHSYKLEIADNCTVAYDCHWH